MSKLTMSILFIVCGTILFSMGIIRLLHDTDVKIDCIKSISKDHYTVDEINRLCGVVKWMVLG